MRIALFHNLPSGGAKRFTCEQVKRLAQRGHEIVEFAPTTADRHFCALAPYVLEQRWYEHVPIELVQSRIPLITPYLHALQGILLLRQTDRINREMAREIDANDYGLALVEDCRFMPSPYVLRYLETPSLFQCHHVQRPVVAQNSHQDLSPTSLLERLKEVYYAPARRVFREFYSRAEVANIRAASHVITNSEYARNTLTARYGVHPAVVYPGIDTELFRPIRRPKENYVLSVGTLHVLKGFRFLVTALGQISPSRRPSLFIASNTRFPDEEVVLRAMASRLGVELEIETILDDERMVQVYNQARVLVYAPIEEALGLVPLEAMACGVPVIAVGEGGVAETVADGCTGWLVDRDPLVFAERLEELLSSDLKQARMGEAGIQHVRSNWTWSSAVDRLEAEFEKVTGNTSRMLNREL